MTNWKLITHDKVAEMTNWKLITYYKVSANNLQLCTHDKVSVIIYIKQGKLSQSFSDDRKPLSVSASNDSNPKHFRLLDHLVNISSRFDFETIDVNNDITCMEATSESKNTWKHRHLKLQYSKVHGFTVRGDILSAVAEVTTDFHRKSLWNGDALQIHSYWSTYEI